MKVKLSRDTSTRARRTLGAWDILTAEGDALGSIVPTIYQGNNYYKVSDRAFLGAALSSDRYFADLVGEDNARFTTMGAAIQFVADQLEVQVADIKTDMGA